MCRHILFFILLICVLQTRGYVEGDNCKVNGITGICKRRNQCPTAVQDIDNRSKTETCAPTNVNPVGHDPLVCCVTSEGSSQGPPLKTTIATSKSSTTTEYEPAYNDYEETEPEANCPPIGRNYTALKTGQKAWDKCIGYQEEYVYPCTSSLALTGGKTRLNNCKHNAKELIVNGIDAIEAEFPHMALLGYNTSERVTFSCGGSVVSEYFILTAGHCIHGGRILGPVMYILVGTLKRSDKYKTNDLYNVKNIIKHPNYESPMKYHDIALLKTDRRIKLSMFVVPACLDVGKQRSEQAWATGWGATSYAGSNADILQKVQLTKFTEEECSARFTPNRYMRRGFDPRTQLCYGDERGEAKDTCGGDSGGPIQILSSHVHCMYVVVGVTSFGRNCAGGEPAIYTKVLEYLPWIESVVWP